MHFPCDHVCPGRCKQYGTLNTLWRRPSSQRTQSLWSNMSRWTPGSSTYWMRPSGQTAISLDPLLCIHRQTGSSPILRLPKTLKSFSVIFTERALLQGSRRFTYSALVRLANTLGLVWFCDGGVAVDSLPCTSHSRGKFLIIIFDIRSHSGSLITKLPWERRFCLFSKNFIYLQAVLALHSCTLAFPSWGKQGLL